MLRRSLGWTATWAASPLCLLGACSFFKRHPTPSHPHSSPQGPGLPHQGVLGQDLDLLPQAQHEAGGESPTGQKNSHCKPSPFTPNRPPAPLLAHGSGRLPQGSRATFEPPGSPTPLNIQNMEEKLPKGVYRIFIFKSEKLDNMKCLDPENIPLAPPHSPKAQMPPPPHQLPHPSTLHRRQSVTGIIFECKQYVTPTLPVSYWPQHWTSAKSHPCLHTHRFLSLMLTPSLPLTLPPLSLSPASPSYEWSLHSSGSTWDAHRPRWW